MTLSNEHDIDLLFSSPAAVYSSLEDMSNQEFEILKHISSKYSDSKDLHSIYKNLNIELDAHDLKIDHFKKIATIQNKNKLQQAVLGGSINYENVKHVAKTTSKVLWDYKYDITTAIGMVYLRNPTYATTALNIIRASQIMKAYENNYKGDILDPMEQLFGEHQKVFENELHRDVVEGTDLNPERNIIHY